MLKFYRRIRQKLLSENHFSKYRLYALGEIVLVVIGILIALQINKRNEYEKNKAFEKEILEQLSAHLIKDKLTLKDVSSNFDAAVNSTQKILGSHWSPREQDSLKYWLGNVVKLDCFQPLTNAYEVAKSKGLDFKYRNDLVVKDYIAFAEEKGAKGILWLNQDNYRSGLIRIKRVIVITENLQALIKEELHTFSGILKRA